MDLKRIRKRIAQDAKAGILPGNRGFLFKPKGAARAHALLLHGFSASPHEVRDFGVHLKKKGYLVYAPRIAGHGVGRQEFDSKGLIDWEADAQEAYGCLWLKGKKMVLAGHSGGGALAARLAQAHKGEVSALVLAAPAFKLADPYAPLSRIPLARWFRPTLAFKPRHKDAKYWTLTYSSHRIAQLLRLGSLAVKDARRLSLPLLLLQARGDNLVSCRFNEALFEKIPSPKKRLIVYDSEEHNVLHWHNPIQKKVFSWIDIFLKKQGV